MTHDVILSLCALAASAPSSPFPSRAPGGLTPTVPLTGYRQGQIRAASTTRPVRKVRYNGACGGGVIAWA
jgi:hypothetical protein